MTVRLELIPPRELTDEDIRWMIEACKDSFDNVSPIEQAEAARKGYAGVYRIVGDAVGVVILSPAAGMESTMTITGLAGRGLLRNFTDVHKAILVAAAATGSRRVNGYALRPGLQKLYLAKTKARLVPMFVEDIL